MSSNQSIKIDWLREQGHIVHNPLLDYKSDGKTIFTDLEHICELNRIDLIIGSSMGGHLAFHLGNKYNIATLLFNPSLAKNKTAKPDVRVFENESVLHTIVLGENDNIVISENTISFLKDKNVNFVHTFESNEHRTPIEILKKHFDLLIQKENTLKK